MTKRKFFEITTMSKKKGQIIWRLPNNSVSALINIDDELVYYTDENKNFELADETELLVDKNGFCTRVSKVKDKIWIKNEKE